MTIFGTIPDPVEVDNRHHIGTGNQDLAEHAGHSRGDRVSSMIPSNVQWCQCCRYVAGIPPALGSETSRSVDHSHGVSYDMAKRISEKPKGPRHAPILRS